MQILLEVETLKTAISLYHLTGVMHPSAGAVMGDADFVDYSPDGVAPATKHLRLAVTTSQSSAPIITLWPIEHVRLAAGRVPYDVLELNIGPNNRIVSTQVVGDSVDALVINVTTAIDLIDQVAAALQ